MDRKWWTLVAVSVGTFMLLLDVTIVNVALPAIQTSLHASFSDLQWVVDAYSLMLAALLLTTGSLADLFGRRLVFVIGLVIFSVSSLLSGLASDPLWLNLARGAQGVGGAAMFSTSLALLGSAFQGRERGVAFGVWGAITGLAVAIGPVIGGALTTGLSWRWIFLVNVPIGVIAVFISMLRVDESRQTGARRPDPIGVVTFSGALGALVYALIKGNTIGWGSTEILACLIGAGVLLILFVIAELIQRENAMFDLNLFRKPTFTGGSIAAFALSAGMFALLLYLTLYLQDVLGYSALQTGVRLLVLSGGILLTSTLAGRLTAHVPIRFLIAPGLALVGIGLLLMRGLNASSHWTHLTFGFIVAGAGVGLINPPLASTAIGVVSPDRAGMASGINSTFRQVGIATGIAGLGSIFSHKVRTEIVSMLSGAPHLTSTTTRSLAENVAQGNGAKAALVHLAPDAKAAAVHAVRTSFTSALNEVFLIGAILTLVAALLTLVLIRSKDFEAGAARGPAAQETAPASPAALPPSPAAAPALALQTGSPEAGAPQAAPSSSEPQPAAAPIPDASAPTPAPAAFNDGELVQSSEALVLAAEQAAADYAHQVEAQIARHRAAELAAAAEQAERLEAAARARSEEYAALLRRRESELSAERERLVAELRRHVESAIEQADLAVATRAELYRIIGVLGRLDSDLNRNGDSDDESARASNGGGHPEARTVPEPRL
jgi:EmrB/QacA subfamily drug resistance transporter